ncbi:phosphotransferase [Nonomuraea sp. SMC257]|uniref:Phosphotransferase n=1 Tax=Nonomuraea montanisoli TaxID=2741721 RepID=A0A7Y6I4S9_9ACTN|nr:phosphotransferase [Nonomuraea montanisoli]NUW31717.1 phosphotransferase [Nonomuraea montanisoli]
MPFATITAISPGDRWWLAEDFGGVDGRAVPAERRRACLTQLVRVQKETLARDDIWRAPRLPKNLDRALGGEEADRLQALTPYLVECAERLDEAGIPATIVHRDLRPGNVVVREEGILCTTGASPDQAINGWRKQGSSVALRIRSTPRTDPQPRPGPDFAPAPRGRRTAPALEFDIGRANPATTALAQNI